MWARGGAVSAAFGLPLRHIHAQSVWPVPELGAFALFGLKQLDLGEGAVLSPVFGLQVAEAWCSMRMNAAGELWIAVLLVEALRDPVAYVPVVRAF